MNSARRIKRASETSAVLLQICRTMVAGLILVGMSPAQQTAQEPVQPALRVQTDVVVVPFQVRRGSRLVSDLKPADVVLLEDGVPRSFTIFDAPPVHLTLDLVVMFDVTNPRVTPPMKDLKGRAGFWDTKALHDLADDWSEAITQRLLDQHGASIRFSIYRFDQFRLQRLCQSTSDPRVLVDALHRLAVPGPAAQDVDIPLPAGLTIRNMERKAQANGNLPQPWSLAGAVSALKDSAIASSPGGEKVDAGSAMPARALVIFSTGAEGTTITPQDLADQAVAAGVPVYPVALPGFPWVLPYEGYTYRSPVNYGFYYSYIGLKRDEDHADKPSMFGPGGANYVNGSGYVVSYYNYPFELLGDLTGGLRFDALNHFAVPDSNTLSLKFFQEGYSMTGDETDNVLERVKKHAVARFSTNYTVGFVPSPSDSPREHKLEVKLAPKSSGKVTEGKRSATY